MYTCETIRHYTYVLNCCVFYIHAIIIIFMQIINYIVIEIFTIAGSEEVLESGSVDLEAGHRITFTVEILERSHSAHVQLTDAVITNIDVCQSDKHTKVNSLFNRQHQLVHSQVQLLHIPHLRQCI